MRVCIVGGIFDKPPEYRARHVHTPETILAEGLRSRGLDVVTRGHSVFEPDERFDVVHVHHIGRAAYRMSAARTRSTFVFTGHDGAMLCGYERSPIRRAAFAHVVRQADALVALSHAEREYLSRLSDGTPIRVIHNGIPSKVFTGSAAAMPSAAAPYELLCVGQLVPLKGVDTLLHALRQVVSTHAVTLRLVYQVNTCEAEYRRLAESLGIAAHVRFEGIVAPEALAELYQRAALLVHPSRAEALPSVIAEAMLCGTPIVASRVGGIPEQLGDFGTLVEPGNADALAAAIRTVLDDLPARKARGAEMRRSAESRFNISTMIDRHCDFYETLLAVEPRHRSTGPVQHVTRLLLRGAIKAYWPSGVPLSRRTAAFFAKR
jgi:glycosyltransferase involved in cell wall biosynthesis